MEVVDGGPWQGPTEEEWLERIAAPSTPNNETIPWIKPSEMPQPHVEEEVEPR